MTTIEYHGIDTYHDTERVAFEVKKLRRGRRVFWALYRNNGREDYGSNPNEAMLRGTRLIRTRDVKWYRVTKDAAGNVLKREPYEPK
jgi:hypothetical protein